MPVVDRKIRPIAAARKNPATGKRLQTRRRITTRNINPFTYLTVLVPFHRNAMGRILRGQPPCRRPSTRPQFPEPDEANARDRPPLYQLGPETGRQQFAYRIRIDAIIHQYPPVNNADHRWS